MEAQVALLQLPSSSFRASRHPHSAVVLHFSSPALFARPPCLRSRVAPCRASASEEERWLREERRWLREEERWLREEARWDAERRLMADELGFLKREVEQLREQVQERSALPSVVATLKQLVQGLPVEEPRPNIEFVQEKEFAPEFVEEKEFDRPSSLSFAPSSSPPPSIPSMSEFSIDLMADEAAAVSLRELRKGAEGDEVKALQEALEALGFYSGEEEIEYSMFSTDTEAAVKSWQASLGVREDGVASSDLLAALYGKRKPPQNGADPWSAPAAPASDVRRKKTFAEDKRDIESSEIGDIAPNRRVFLLGENRWEDAGRLGRPASKSNGTPSPSSNGQKSNGASSPSSKAVVATEKCFSCKGEGAMMCTECEGTGDLNVEDQFLDWVEEGAKCPYCEGSGAVPCDVCLGEGATPQV